MNKDAIFKNFQIKIKRSLDNNRPLSNLIEFHIKKFYDENKSLYDFSMFEQYFKRANLIENNSIRKKLISRRRVILLPVAIALFIEALLLNNIKLQNYIIFIAALTLTIGIATVIYFGVLFNKLNKKRYNDWYSK